jgi:starch synthase (maltosyl-transferring)
LRPVIENVRPSVDGGAFDTKTTTGEVVRVRADVICDGHDELRCEVHYRHLPDGPTAVAPLRLLNNDLWQGEFVTEELGRYEFVVTAEVDEFATWRRDLAARSAAGQDVAIELVVGAEHLRAAATRARGLHRRRLEELADAVAAGEAGALASLGESRVAEFIARFRDPDAATRSPAFGLRVDLPLARCSTWYELFPRSTAPEPGAHGTFADVEARLDYIVQLGADIVYLPPIHPIGTTKRKGRNGAVVAEDSDVGSPWAIGSPLGGHTAVHPDLGTLADFAHLVAAASAKGLTIALDLAYQCSPDHPWVAEHPEWFKHRPDGSIRYAENPPKRYEDIYPIDFETEDWEALWAALADVVYFWVARGVHVFRVDNPHTKPFAFWQWLIETVKARHPEVIFLAEAFTRPKIMYRLAKLGFTQSYTYFAWRNTKAEIEEYLTELTHSPVADFFRPNFWPNTPDILTEALQTGGQPMFIVRALLAATLTANYGIYGPVFELGEHVARDPGSEEYLDSEKYAIHQVNLGAASSLAPFISRLNAVRRTHLCLQYDGGLSFQTTDNDQIISYAKVVPSTAAAPATTDSDRRPILAVVNLDSHNSQSAWITIDRAGLGVAGTGPYVVRDLLTGSTYTWSGERNFVILDPAVAPAHLFRVEHVDGESA